MPLVDMKQLITHAYHNGYAVGGFHIFSLESLAAVISAADHCRAPVILNVSHTHADLFDIETLVAAAECAASRAPIPVAIHFDHGGGVEGAVQALRWGCNGVTCDGSQLPLPDNIERTRAMVAMAHSCGVPVEGIVGCVAGEHHPGTQEYGSRAELTSVDEAKAFVERTGVDFLAIAVGTGHGRLGGRCKLDMQRISRIKAAVQVPLVVHGGSGVSEEQVRRLLAGGVAKINYYTMLAEAAQAKITANLRTQGRGPLMMLTAGVGAAIQAQVETQLRILGSAGRAAEVLLRCRAWQPVEHVIIFNVSTNAAMDIAQVMAHGRHVLSEIPGVRSVFAGSAVKSGAAYRFCWLIRFIHPTVIDSYREHPIHKRFAEELFRPIAPDRISIDFESLGTAQGTPGADSSESGGARFIWADSPGGLHKTAVLQSVATS